MDDSTGIEARLTIDTDVAQLLMFHPDDLAHAAGWPMNWHADTFVYPVESAAGRLLGWETSYDGTFDIRVTGGMLTEREQTYAGPSWIFPLTVRHGRIYIDNANCIPFATRFEEPSENNWVDVPNGVYRVTVTGVEWSAEPGVAEDGSNGLPDYVVQFAPADSTFQPALCPPDLRPFRDAEAMVRPWRDDEDAAVERDVDFSRSYPAIACETVAPTGIPFTVEGDALLVIPSGPFDLEFVVAPQLTSGATGVVARIYGTSSGPDGLKSCELSGVATVRIRSVATAHLGLAVEIEPITVAADDSVTVDFDELRASVMASLSDGPLAELLGPRASYERLRIPSFATRERLSDWLVRTLPMRPAERLEMSAFAPGPRANAVAAVLTRMQAGDVG